MNCIIWEKLQRKRAIIKKDEKLKYINSLQEKSRDDSKQSCKCENIKGQATNISDEGKILIEMIVVWDKRNFCAQQRKFVPGVPVACAISWRKSSRLCSYTQRRALLPIPV